MEFSEKQKEAINTRSVNILVQAAAGSGKTRVLVEKIIRLVCGIEEKEENVFVNVEKVPIDKILVMTFTNNATNEMKNRIKKGLADVIREKEKNGEDIDELEYQLSMVNNANIQTIDSFCKEIIDHNFTRLEKLDPKYRIAEDKELELLRYDVQSVVLEKYYSDDRYKDFLKLYFNKDDEKLRSMLDKGLFYVSSKAFPRKYIEDLKNNFDINNKKAVNDYKKNVISSLRNELQSKVNNISILFKDVKNVTPKVDNEKNKCQISLFDSELALCVAGIHEVMDAVASVALVRKLLEQFGKNP
ncbi:MAG: UvrD-helicase domain-containing protein, partial [Lachnospiraceae bacterium]|nr:UvrD-helicase domain-containing protein [Lachnospiraceae bacterium]